MSEAVLPVEKRVETGKSFVRKLRRDGRVPGTVYGGESTPISFSVDALEVARLLRGDHSIVKVEIDGKSENAVVKDVQIHPVYGQVMHIDFLRVVAGQEITINVPIHFIGNSAGVKLGGLLSTMKHEVNISVLPRNMPESIEVDISDLEVGDAIRLSDIKSDKFTILDDESEMIVQVTMQRTAAENEADILEDSIAAETAETAESAEPEVITAKDKEDES